MSMFSTETARTLRRTALSAAAGAAMMMAASTSFAAIVWSGPVNLNIPATTNGLYLNVVTGVSNLPAGGAGTTVPGWDINIWSTAGLGFFNPTAPLGGVYVSTAAGVVANLMPGANIGATSSFSNGVSTNLSQWNLNSSNNYFGFRFNNEAGGTTHFGWGQLAIGATITERSLISYAFESTPGLAIQAGVVPEPGTYALMGLGLAGLALAARRRKQD